MQASTAPHVDITHYCFSQNAQSLEGAIDTVDSKTLFTEEMIVEKKKRKEGDKNKEKLLECREA